DAGREAGLGHVARSSAVATALRCREIETRCLAHGADEPFRFDGVDWAPLNGNELPEANGHVLLIDSYRLSPEAVAASARPSRLVVMHDDGDVPPGAALAISVVGAPDATAGRLSGLEYAALRPGFWGLPSRRLNDDAGEILVTTGGGLFAETGLEVARSLAE